MKINYVKGDLFQNLPKDKKVLIPHIVSDDNKWGAGFVVALSRFNKLPELEYRKWASHGPAGYPYELGYTQSVEVSDSVMISNMLAQHKTIREEPIPIRYWALCKCMRQVKKICAIRKLEIHAPRFGAGLARGNWDFIETLINEIWVNEGIPTTIYEL